MDDRATHRQPILGARRRASVDGFIATTQKPERTPTLTQPAQPAPAPIRPSASPIRKSQFSGHVLQRPVHRKKRSWSALQDIAIVCGAFILGFLIQSNVVGQIAIAAYAVLALVLRIASRTTFLLAIMSLAIVLLFSLRSNPLAASTFAVYAFLLLAVGVISLGREARDEV